MRSALIRPAVTHSRIDWVLTPNKDAAWGVVSLSSDLPVLTRLLPGLIAVVDGYAADLTGHLSNGKPP